MANDNDPGTSAKPRKQRKRLAEADKQTRRKLMSAHLSEDLMLEFDRRSMPVREGDTVEIVRGDFKGQEGEVLEVDRKRLQLEIDGVTNRRADGTQVPRPVHPSNVIITDLHLTDPKRRAAIERKGVEVEVPPEPEEEEEEDQPEEAEPETPAAEGTKGPAPPEPEPEPEPETDLEAPEEPEPDAAPESEEAADVDEDETGKEPEDETEPEPEADLDAPEEPEPDAAPESEEAADAEDPSTAADDTDQAPDETEADEEEADR